MAPGRVCPQHSSRPSASVITSALTVLARALPETNQCRPALWAAGHQLVDLLQDGELAVGKGGAVELTVDGYGYRWLRVVGPDSRRLV
jgi:hypothetical protein